MERWLRGRSGGASRHDDAAGYWDCTYAPLHDHAGAVDGVIIIADEVTERVETRLRAERAEAERRDAGFTPTLRSRDLPEHRTIERQVLHLTRLVDDLLDLSRITRGLVELRRESVDMAEIVARAVELASPLTEQKRHRLSVDARPGLGVEGDPVRLVQIVSNLLTNAARYTAAGGNLQVRAWLEDERVVVEVVDDGAGIAPEVLPRIFDPFVQGPRGVARSDGGLGIGLALVRSFVGLQQIRARGFTTCRLVALTGYGQRGDRERALAAGFEIHLVKPVDLQRILAVVAAPGPTSG